MTIDWTLRESARAKIKVMVKRILNKYGYPPDLQEEAVKTVLQQAELLCAEWVNRIHGQAFQKSQRRGSLRKKEMVRRLPKFCETR